MQINTHKLEVAELLKNPLYRDDDNKLLARIWFNQIGRDSSMPVKNFLMLLSTGKLASLESVTRMRRKLQEENPGLRGSTWEFRQRVQKGVKKDLGYKVSSNDI